MRIGAIPVVYIRSPGRSPIVSDTFTRADSALTLGSAETGQTWTAVTGTWGISSNQAYSASDANADIAVIDTGVTDCTLDYSISGDFTNATTYRTPVILFAYADASNHLRTYLYNGTIILDKKDGGTYTTLTSAAQTTTSGTTYDLRVVRVGNSITVSVNSTAKLSHTLTGGNTKYAGYTSVGMELGKALAPATAARWDNLRVQVT